MRSSKHKKGEGARFFFFFCQCGEEAGRKTALSTSVRLPGEQTQLRRKREKSIECFNNKLCRVFFFCVFFLALVNTSKG